MANTPGTFELEGWPKGLVLSVDETALGEEELVEALNVVIDARGDVKSRPGYDDSTKSGYWPAKLGNVFSWWPNNSSGEILVGVSPEHDHVHVVRSQASYPYAVDMIDMGSAYDSYDNPTDKEYWITSVASLNDPTGELYIVARRGSDAVYRLDWVDDSTVPTVTAMTKATLTLAEKPPDVEKGTVDVNATGGTFDIGSLGDVTTVAYNISSADLQAKLRALVTFGSELTVEASGSDHLISLAETDPTIVVDDDNATGGTVTYAVTSTQIEADDEFPVARFALSKHARMWVANITIGSDDYPSRVLYSDVLKPEKWYSLNYLDFNPADGQEITAFVEYGESILVFKNNNISILTGKTEESFAITMLDEAVGTVSPKSVAVVGAQAMFFDRDHGVWAFDGAQFTDASENIRDYLLDGINYDYAWSAAGFIRRNVYYLSVPWGSAKTPNRTFVYDMDGGLWYEWDFGFNQAAPLDGDWFAAVDGLAGFAKLFTGTTDDGTAIDSYMTTGWNAPAGGGSQHRIRRLDASFADEGTAQSVKVEAFKDYEAAAFHSETVVPDDTALFQRIGGFGNKRWQQIKMKISSVSGSAWRLNRLSMRLTVGQRGRGVDDPNG